MYIQVNAGEHVKADAALSARIEEQVRSALGHMASQITTVELNLDDENAGGEGGNDKRCSLEVHPTGHRALAVHHNATTVEDAAQGAARKMRQRLESVLGKRSDVKGGESIRKTGSI